jgi:hypothetical protein
VYVTAGALPAYIERSSNRGRKFEIIDTIKPAVAHSLMDVSKYIIVLVNINSKLSDNTEMYCIRTDLRQTAKPKPYA